VKRIGTCLTSISQTAAVNAAADSLHLICSYLTFVNNSQTTFFNNNLFLYLRKKLLKSHQTFYRSSNILSIGPKDGVDKYSWQTLRVRYLNIIRAASKVLLHSYHDSNYSITLNLRVIRGIQTSPDVENLLRPLFCVAGWFHHQVEYLRCRQAVLGALDSRRVIISSVRKSFFKQSVIIIKL